MPRDSETMFRLDAQLPYQATIHLGTTSGSNTIPSTNFVRLLQDN